MRTELSHSTEGKLAACGPSIKALLQELLLQKKCQSHAGHKRSTFTGIVSHKKDCSIKKLYLRKDTIVLTLRTGFGSCLLSWIFLSIKVLLFCSFLLRVRIYKICLLQSTSANLYH